MKIIATPEEIVALLVGLQGQRVIDFKIDTPKIDPWNLPSSDFLKATDDTHREPTENIQCTN